MVKISKLIGFEWYPFVENSNVLCVINADEFVDLTTSAFCNVNTIIANPDEVNSVQFGKRYDSYFDYIVLIEVIERIRDPLAYLKSMHNILNENGTMLIGVSNRWGIKYLIGETDPFTGRYGTGIENYREEDIEKLDGRLYSASDIYVFLRESDWKYAVRYSVFPGIRTPKYIFRDGVIPEEDLAIRCFPKYDTPETVFMYEEHLYSDMIKNGVFHNLANAYIFECSNKESTCDITEATIAYDRGVKSIVTSMNKDTVWKKSIPKDSNETIFSVYQNMVALSKKGIKVAEGELIGNTYVTKRYNGEMANVYLQQMLIHDPKKFLDRLDLFMDAINNSSKILRIDSKLGPIAEKAYLDLVPLNAIFIDNDYVFIDQEFVAEEYPINAIKYRSILIIYNGDRKRNEVLPMDEVLERYGLITNKAVWEKMCESFSENIREDVEGELSRNDSTISKNRERMHYSEEVYENLFYNPFAGLQGRKIIVFGAGKIASKFMEMYQDDYEIYAVIDNNIIKHGSYFSGHCIQSPHILKDLRSEKYRVIICIKDYLPIYVQLKQLGVADIAVYCPNKIYPGRQVIYNQLPERQAHPKKYNIGYIAGVFDLFHVGHLRLLRRAKELCNYLIVGVVSDEGVKDFKNTQVFIPLAERLEIIEACEYVDEVVAIPYYYRGTVEAFEKYHFDVQFSGSDYENDPWWLSMKRYLEEHGSTMVFFPYTQDTSSTKIKQLIDKEIVNS